MRIEILIVPEDLVSAMVYDPSDLPESIQKYFWTRFGQAPDVVAIGDGPIYTRRHDLADILPGTARCIEIQCMLDN